MPTKRQILEQLPWQTLCELVDSFELDSDDRRVKRNLVDALARSRRATLDEIMDLLRRDELKAVCRNFGLDDKARANADLIERILSCRSAPGYRGKKPSSKASGRATKSVAPKGEHLAAWIATRRSELALSQTELAKLVGVSPPAVSRWEAGSTHPRKEVLLRLKEVLADSAEKTGRQSSRRKRQVEPEKRRKKVPKTRTAPVTQTKPVPQRTGNGTRMETARMPGAEAVKYDKTGVIAPGAHIELRDAVWRVVRVDPTSSGKAAWRCVGVSEIVHDQEALFLEEFEPEVRVLDPRTTVLERDTSAHHRAGLLYIESLLRDVPPPADGLYIGHQAVMDKLDFQLDPTWQALSKPRQRILIADAVGLGKTIEAGILLSELIRRGRGRRILVATVKSMLTQFQKEMWGRFSIPLVRLDSVGLQRIRSDIPTHHNPFYYFDRAIISIDTLKQNNWFRTHVEHAYWDVIVIDEAHNVATRGSDQSMRARIAELLARNCDSLILLSATPHDGKPRSFASLMNMLDPTAIADPDDYTKEDIHGLFVRRFKKDVADQLEKRIPKRHIATSKSIASDAEERAFSTLSNLSFTRIDKRATGGLLFKTTLEKSLFSSPAACLQTIKNRIRRLERREDSKDFQKDVNALRLLQEDVQAINDVDSFSKYGQLLEVIRDNWKWKASRAKEDRLVIFTERRETLDFLANHLTKDLGLRDDQWRLLHGSKSDTEQQEIVEAFGKTQDPIRILLATDVAAEGLNLHYLCHRMIHFDVPWSLMVFQQRNGRIDRYGQENEPRIVYLLTESQHAAIKGDTRILELLIEKDEQAQKNIGDPSAFMNVYDIEEEELITGRAMEAGQTTDEFEADLQSRLVDPFALILGEAAAAATPSSDGNDFRGPAPVRKLPSIFSSDFAFLETAARRLQETIGLKAKLRKRERLAEVQAPPDLLRRFHKLPTEVRPEDGVVLLTADPDRMDRALSDARREENAWPQHQYFWPIGPVMDWLTDRLRGEFGRHTAPVLTVTGPFKADETAIIISGLLPNRRAQPLVHRWYVVRFQGHRLDCLQPFTEFLAETGFGSDDLPNPGTRVAVDTLRDLLPVAVEAVSKQLDQDRQAFIDCTAPRLKAEQERLDRLKGRQLDFADLIYGNRTDSIAEQERDKRRRLVGRLFREHQRWVEDAMTTAETPFIQVIAALHRLPEGTKGASK
ncbi:helicase-related protein [Myxococcota bacterium]